jgi:hypothetical protein
MMEAQVPAAADLAATRFVDAEVHIEAVGDGVPGHLPAHPRLHALAGQERVQMGQVTRPSLKTPNCQPHHTKSSFSRTRQRVTPRPRFTAKLVVIVIEIRLQGDIAYDYGWHDLTLTPKDGGEPIRRRDRYVDIWRRNKEGNSRRAQLKFDGHLAAHSQQPSRIPYGKGERRIRP